MRTITLAATLLLSSAALAASPRIEVTIAPSAAGEGPLNGRLLVAISKATDDGPRYQIDESYESQQVFGLDVTSAKPGMPIILDDANSYGYPIRHLIDLQPGTYTVQAVFNRYEEFHLGMAK